MTFSVNQTRQFYVGRKYNATVTNTGDIKPVKNNDYIYFEYVGADKTPMRTDLIKVSNLIYTKKTPADKMARSLKTCKITLDGNINSGKIVAGQDYMVKINIRQYLGIDDGNTMTKYGIVHAVAGMSDSKFYATLALSLAKNFSRDVTPLFSFHLKTSAGGVEEVKANTKLESLSADSYVGVIIKEVRQPWSLGTEAQVPVYFDVFVDTIVYNGEEVTWGNVVNDVDTEKIGNGTKIADMEYFYMGERGDIYRNVGWPNVIKTQYLVDPELEYDVFDIHYSYVGSNEAVQKSEKTITIAVPTAASTEFTNALNTVLANTGFTV